MLTTIQSSPNLVFAFAFCLAVAMQWMVWVSPNPYGDQALWSKDAQIFALGTLPSLNTPTPPHPGTSILLPSAFLIQLGVRADYAVQYAMIFLIASAVGIIALLTHLLRPQSLWWLGATALLAPDARYFDVTPPSAFAALLMCVIFLLLLYGYEHAFSKVSPWLGVCVGILLSTRLDLGLFVVAAALYFVYRTTLRDFLTAAILAVATFFLLDPYLWFTPIQHIAGFWTQIQATSSMSAEFGYPYETLLLAVITWLLACVAIFRTALNPIAREFTVWIVVVSTLLCVAIGFSEYKAMRYFFPAVVLGETFLPLFVFLWYQKAAQSYRSLSNQKFEEIFISLAFLMRMPLTAAIPKAVSVLISLVH